MHDALSVFRMAQTSGCTADVRDWFTTARRHVLACAMQRVGPDPHAKWARPEQTGSSLALHSGTRCAMLTAGEGVHGYCTVTDIEPQPRV